MRVVKFNGESDSGTNWIGAWVGPNPVQGQISCSCWESNCSFSVVQAAYHTKYGAISFEPPLLQ
jgi:hypothetical protein